MNLVFLFLQVALDMEDASQDKKQNAAPKNEVTGTCVDIYLYTYTRYPQPYANLHPKYMGGAACMVAWSGGRPHTTSY